MTVENHHHLLVEGVHMPITICFQCIESGFQIDPRVRNPNYPVIVSTCRTYRICNGEYDHLIGRGNLDTNQQNNTD